MEENKLFIDTLDPSLISKAEEQIKENLFDQFYEEINMDEQFYGDRKYADMSDIKEIREAFNKFYNLSPEDSDYLD